MRSSDYRALRLLLVRGIGYLDVVLDQVVGGTPTLPQTKKLLVIFRRYQLAA